MRERNYPMKVRVYQDGKEKKRRGRLCPWSVEWRENGRRRSKAIGTKSDAEDFASIKRAELLDGAMGLHTRKKWSEFVTEYMEEVKGNGSRPGTVSLVKLVLGKFTEAVSPTWVHLIDAKTLDAYRCKRLQDPGVHGGKLSPETVRKELRHLHAVLGMAVRWKYLREVPPLPRVKGDQHEKPHVTEAHFLAMLKACDAATKPAPRIHPSLPEGSSAGDWWQALLVTAWVTGARVDAILRLRWADVDYQTGRVLSRAADLKQRKDTRPEIAGALPYLEKIRGDDPRLLAWNHHRRTLYTEFYRIQEAAGIELSCPDANSPGHVCGDGCRFYGFHAFRYAHARFNYANPELQQQMGHATAATTEHYRRWGERQLAQYGAYLPAALDDGKEETGQRENAGKDSGKPRLRLVGA